MLRTSCFQINFGKVRTLAKTNFKSFLVYPDQKIKLQKKVVYEDSGRT